MANSQNQLNSEQIVRITEEIDKETDRAAAILAASYLDELLKELITSIMIDDHKVVEELIGQGDTPLGTFSSRIKAAYCLSLIDRQEFNNLHLIRKIRNDFAHRLFGLSFGVSPIKDRALSLVLQNSSVPFATARDQFTVVAVRIMVEIIVRINQKRM